MTSQFAHNEQSNSGFVDCLTKRLPTKYYHQKIGGKGEQYILGMATYNMVVITWWRGLAKYL